MRATVRDVARHPSWVRDWWAELPARGRRWWTTVLFERGQGWLRWGTDDRESWAWEPNAMAHYCEGIYVVAPPARRLAIYLAWWPRAVWFVVVGHKSEDEPRYRFAWDEIKPEWPRDMRDDDRKRLFS